jgi:pimeloyl-ACP methyl ester carboxylesterase
MHRGGPGGGAGAIRRGRARACALVLVGLVALAGCREPAPAGTASGPAAGASGAAAAAAASQLQDSDCWFDNAGANPARCAWLRPDVQDSTGSTRLPVVVLRDLPKQASELAVIYLTGGPGMGSGLDADGLREARMWRASLGLRHDLVRYDQRGSGRAEPSLACPGFESEIRAALAGDLDYGERIDRWFGFLVECTRRVPAADRDAGVYGTVTAAADLGQLMAALRARHGYRGFLLFGESYGTRLAIETLRAQPELPVERMVLDSVHPPGSLGHLVLLPEQADRLLADLDARCRARGACVHAAGGIGAPLRRALDHVAESPLDVTGTDYRSGKSNIRMRLEPRDLFDLVFLALYGHEHIDELPDMLDALVEHGPDPRWQVLFDMAATLWLDAQFSVVAHNLIGCRDNQPVSPGKLAKQFAASPAFRDVLEPLASQQALCLTIGVEPAPLATDWTIAVPTLLLSRAIDPATPLDEVRAVRERFQVAELVVVPGIGHGATFADPELAARVGRFLNGDPDPPRSAPDAAPGPGPDAGHCPAPEPDPYSA